VRSALQRVHPCANWRSVSLDAVDRSSGTMHQDLAQVCFAGLLMPIKRALPPVEYCLGTSPSQAANSRPFRKAAPLPIAATMAVATIGPIPGICWMTATGIGISDAFQFMTEHLDLLLDHLPLFPEQLADPSRM
jgi:hypothetical protein